MAPERVTWGDDETIADMRTHSCAAFGAPQRILRRGHSIGRYVVIDRRGAGSMGVYAACDPELDRKVAIKLLKTEGT